jgi:hypothetical protein
MGRDGAKAGSAAAVEQAGYRPVLEDLLDRTSDHRGNRENGEFVEILVRSNGQRIGDDNLGDAAVCQGIGGGGVSSP